MFRRTLRRVVPTFAIFPLLLTGLTDVVAYMGAKLLQSIFSFSYIDLTTVYDAAFPFSPAWVLIYIATYAFWIYQYTTVAKESPEAACRLAAADTVAKLLCLIFFVAMPTTNVRPEVEGTGLIPFLMRAIYSLDTPTNLFPSIHCFVAWMGTRYLFRRKNLRYKALTCTLCVIGSLLVFASTLYTKQHVILDVIGGVAVAEVGYLVARFTKLPALIGKLNDRFLKTPLSRIL